MAELFGIKRPAVTKHLRNIFVSGELAEDSVGSILEHTAGDGKVYGTKLIANGWSKCSKASGANCRARH
jgi:hypothetical protein